MTTPPFPDDATSGPAPSDAPSSDASSSGSTAPGNAAPEGGAGAPQPPYGPPSYSGYAPQPGYGPYGYPASAAYSGYSTYPDYQAPYGAPAAPGAPAWHPGQPAYPGQPQPPQGTRRSGLAGRLSRPRVVLGATLAAAVLAGAGTGAGITAAVLDTHSGSSLPRASTGSPFTPSGNTGSGTGNSGSSGTGSGSLPRGRFPGSAGGGYPGGSGYPGTSSSVSASAAQSVGVVDIVTDDGYQGAEAAGTGLVLTSSGEILTNNHVIDGATAVKVTVVSTGKTYTAKVVGDAPTKDIAVLQLSGASGLATARLGSSSSIAVDQSVTGVGNAGGTGGTPSAARGTITALGKSITASDDNGSGAERLHNVIVTNAAIEPGDSGGPLYNSANKVIGIDTAASSGAQATQSFAIPINRALTIAGEIEASDASATIHLGYPAFIGIGLEKSAGRPVVAQVYNGSPAANAGLVAGDTITAVDGTAVSSYTRLHALIGQHSPGDTVSITYTTRSGASRTASVTLTAGPAD